MRAIAGVLIAATVGFLIYGLAIDNAAVAIYVPTTVAIVVVVGLVHRSAQFSMPMLWALTALAVGNLAGGILVIDGEPLYEMEVIGTIRFDKVYHAIASGVAVAASLEALEHWTGERRYGFVLAAFLMALGAGAIVEVVEFTATLLRENTLVGDYANNAQDLIANTVGASVAAVALWLTLRHRTRHGVTG